MRRHGLSLVPTGILALQARISRSNLARTQIPVNQKVLNAVQLFQLESNLQAEEIRNRKSRVLLVGPRKFKGRIKVPGERTGGWVEYRNITVGTNTNTARESMNSNYSV
ncbi:hypothetical protein L873DRAFT_1799552 [Choiromyces venosus 120613-1]|uniref:Uncharacterized protein n=1 Tax=Choiromyces venosus 120613-1 TaxID=1336337 RepID=A0A3N4K0N8_9PEZI|nr:hypothetical protein L873DRAFT_1799552 [Choiromyces venosus 120613-1]